VIVARVCADVRVGNAADTIVAPEPPVRVNMHSPPESTGATSGTNARIAASPLRGLNESLSKTRLAIGVAVPVDVFAGAGVVSGGWDGRELHATMTATPAKDTSVFTSTVMVSVSCESACSPRGTPDSAAAS
jgi:hypothetical protein